MDITDIAQLIAGGVPAQAEQALKLLNGLTPKHFVGNEPPNTHHFASVDHFAWGGDLAKKVIWWEFDYTDAGVQTKLRAEVPFSDMLEVGKRGSKDVIYVNGVAQAGPEDALIGSRFGWFGARVIFEFYWTGHHVRFDQA